MDVIYNGRAAGARMKFHDMMGNHFFNDVVLHSEVQIWAVCLLCSRYDDCRL